MLLEENKEKIGGMMLGLWLDQTIKTIPWFTILGLLLGTILTIMLVREQLKRGHTKKEPLNVK